MVGRALPRVEVVTLERLRFASLPLAVLAMGGLVVCDDAFLGRVVGSVLATESFRGDTICVGLRDTEESDCGDCLESRLVGICVADELTVSYEDGTLPSVIRSWNGERSKSCWHCIHSRIMVS